MQHDPGRAAYEARFAHARPRDVEPWDSLPAEVKAIWARVEAAYRPTLVAILRDAGDAIWASAEQHAKGAAAGVLDQVRQHAFLAGASNGFQEVADALETGRLDRLVRKGGGGAA